jgi:PAS domain S-box-containing protein
MARDATVTGIERTFGDDEIIVSKTDLKGRMTYCNSVFLRIAGYAEADCLGQPHSMIRHPEMPRCVFKLLWDTIEAGREIFAYVVNRAKNGDHYWVLAHVTPSRDSSGNIVGYHSNRRVPERSVVDTTIIPLYRDLLAIERESPDRKIGMQNSTDTLVSLLHKRGIEYDRFVATLAA